MATRHRTFRFNSADYGGIAQEMTEFALDSDGRRWLNVFPDADENEIHTGSAMWKIFSSRGPVIPQLTWFPAHEHRAQHQLAQVGLAHATGRGAMERLAEHGIELPDRWRVAQDHQKRGVILVLEDGVDVEPVLTFGMAAIRLLSPFQFEDGFLATFSQQ